jgi:predicted RNA-binding protein Jag
MTTGYEEFTGKTVEEALRHAREAFGVGSLDELDFEILTAGSRGVLGMGAEPARIVAAPRSALGGAAPRRAAAEATPLPPPTPSPERRGPGGDGRRDFGPRREGRRDDRGGRGERMGPAGDRIGDRERADRMGGGVDVGDAGAGMDSGERVDRGPVGLEPRPDRGDRRPMRGGGRDRRPERRDRPAPGGVGMSPGEEAQVMAARAASPEHDEMEGEAVSAEALQAGQAILAALMTHLGYDVTVEAVAGETSRLNVLGANDEERQGLGALIGRKGERLSALQHLLNLMLSKQMGEWTRILVDVEGYRGRRERQLRELAQRAAMRVEETGRMLQLEPMTALERRWIHLALRGHGRVVTQSIGEEPERRVVVLPRAEG